MSAFFYYASFPNSRNAQRSATKQASTYQKELFDYTLPLTRIADASLNRTYVTLENFSQANSIFYLYADTINVDPTVTPTFGVTTALIYNDVSNTVYQKQDDGLNTNWLVIAPEDVAELIFPGASATLDALQDVYAFVNSAIPIVPSVFVGIDAGRG